MGDTPPLTAGRRAEQEARERRLAQALRDNLLRRKEQARAREEKRSADASAADAERPRG